MLFLSLLCTFFSLTSCSQFGPLKHWDSSASRLFAKVFISLTLVDDSARYRSQQHTIVFLLCVSCPSANEFSAILFLLLARLSSKSPRSLAGFRRTLVQNYIQIRQRVSNFPIDPHCKIVRFRQPYNVAESRQSL